MHEIYKFLIYSNFSETTEPSAVWSSRVFEHPISSLWQLIRPLDFRYLSNVASCTLEDGVAESAVGAFVNILLFI